MKNKFKVFTVATIAMTLLSSLSPVAYANAKEVSESPNAKLDKVMSTITTNTVDNTGSVMPISTTNTDTVLPSITINTVDNTDTVISGTAEPNSTVVVVYWELDKEEPTYCELTTDASGKWNVEMDQPLLASQLVVALTEAEVTIGSETFYPINAEIEFVQEASIPVTINPVGETDTVVTGTAPAGATVALQIEGNILLDDFVIADENGNWSVTLPHTLEAGSPVCVRVSMNPTDDGTMVYTDAVNFVVDETVQTVNVDPIEVGDTVVTGTVSEPSYIYIEATVPVSGPIEIQGGTPAYEEEVITESQIIDMSDVQSGEPIPWTVEFTNPSLPDGFTGGSEIRVYTVDETGGHLTTEEFVLEDTQGSGGPTEPTEPTIPSTPDDNILPSITIDTVDNTDTVISGTAEPNSEVLILTWEDEYEVTSDADGNWSVQLEQPLFVNEPVAAIIETEVTIGSETFYPFNSEIEFVQEASIPVTINPVKETDTVVTGTAPPGASVGLQIEGDIFLNANEFAIADENGNWSVPLPHTLEAGSPVCVRVSMNPTDDGTMVYTDAINFVVDETIQTVNVDPIEVGDTVVTGTVSEPSYIYIEATVPVSGPIEIQGDTSAYEEEVTTESQIIDMRDVQSGEPIPWVVDFENPALPNGFTEGTEITIYTVDETGGHLTTEEFVLGDAPQGPEEPQNPEEPQDPEIPQNPETPTEVENTTTGEKNNINPITGGGSAVALYAVTTASLVGGVVAVRRRK